MAFRRRIPTKPKLLLLDADIVIGAHCCGVWESLLDAADIAVAETVARTEAQFYSKEVAGIPVEINLPRLIAEGRVTQLSASLEDIASISSIFEGNDRVELHAGETESLALLYSKKADGRLFCSADAVAIQALAMLGLWEQGTALETVLTSTGLQRSLSSQYTDEYFQRLIRKGQERRMMGEGVPH